MRPLGKYKGINSNEQLEKFVNDITNNNLRITQFLADSLKRSTAKNCYGHSAYFPCEYCFSRGVLVKVGNNRKITWPSSTAGGELRTASKVRDIVERLENGEVLRPNEKKGVKGRSIFLDLPNFDYVNDTPTEYLHSSCLGVTKRLVELTFDVGETRFRVTDRRLSKASEFNALMALVLTPREFPRRARDLDFSVFKGAEFRNLSLFYFPLIIECIEEEAGERKLWLYLAYMIRSCVLPEIEFESIDLESIENSCKHYYKLYERLFGKVNCTYNTHIVCSHLMLMRIHGPLTETSTFGFESFYGDMRRCFVPGTAAPLKQIFKKILLKRFLDFHCCELTIHYSPKNTSLESNRLIYCYNNESHFIYIINEILDDGETFICNEIETEVHVLEDIPYLDWSKVGVYVKGETKNENVNIYKNDVCGKVLEVGKYLITCPNNILREK